MELFQAQQPQTIQQKRMVDVIFYGSYFTIAFYMSILFQRFISSAPPPSHAEADPTQRKGPGYKQKFRQSLLTKHIFII